MNPGKGLKTYIVLLALVLLINTASAADFPDGSITGEARIGLLKFQVKQLQQQVLHSLIMKQKDPAQSPDLKAVEAILHRYQLLGARSRISGLMDQPEFAATMNTLGRRVYEMKRLAHQQTPGPAKTFTGTGAQLPRLTPGFASGPNDACENSSPIQDGVTIQGDTCGATADGFSSCSYGPGPDVWFRYTAQEDGPVLANLVDTTAWMTVSVHSGCPGVIENEIACGEYGRAVFDAQAGETYLIRVAGIDETEIGGFRLSVHPSGSIVGDVIDSYSSSPIQDASVDLIDTEDNYVDSTTTDRTGHYSFQGVSAATYFIVAHDDNGHLAQLYDHLPMADPVTGTPVIVKDDQTTGPIHFALDPGGSISGHLRDAKTGSPITEGYTIAETADDPYAGFGFLDENGAYRVSGLPAGFYYIRTSTYAYLDELYDNVACPGSGCELAGGTPVAVNLGQETSGINFDLDLGATITGKVWAPKGPGVGEYDVEVDIVNSQGEYVGWSYIDDSGNYSVPGLPTGTHFAVAYMYEPYFSRSPYVDQIYKSIPCFLENCDVTTGKPLSLVTGKITDNINFKLSMGGLIAGRVIDSNTGKPLMDVRVQAFDQDGNWVSSGSTNKKGVYEVPTLNTGRYYAVARSETHLGQLYPATPCDEGCDVTAGTPVDVKYGLKTGRVDFQLQEGGRISGTVLGGDGNPLSYVELGLFDLAGNGLSFVESDENGGYNIPGLETGNYFIRTFNYDNYLDKAYHDADCSPGSCDFSKANSVAVVAGQNTPDINFVLDATGGGIAGTITDALDGMPIRGFVEIFDSTGQSASFGFGDSCGRYRSEGALPSGSFFVKTDEWEYQNELYNNLICPDGCDPTTGTPVSVTSGSTTDGIDFSLEPEN